MSFKLELATTYHILSTTFMKKLLQLAKTLRSEKGCPWDRKQTIDTMIKYLHDELNELEEAVKKRDFDNIEEEVGDILFSMVLLVEIASEESKVNFHNVLNKIEEKIISRHTWVFGDDKATTAEEALTLWRKNKAKEPGRKKKKN